MCDEGGFKGWKGKWKRNASSDLSFIIAGNRFFICNSFSCIGFSLGEEWENGCRWRQIGRRRGRPPKQADTLDVEATVHRHDRAQEDGDAFWLSGEGGKIGLKQQSINCACGAVVA